MNTAALLLLLLLAVADAFAGRADLDGDDWMVTNSNRSILVNASVPGTVPDALHAGGIIGARCTAGEHDRQNPTTILRASILGQVEDTGRNSPPSQHIHV